MDKVSSNFDLLILDNDQSSKEVIKNELHFSNDALHTVVLCLQQKGQTVGGAFLIKTNPSMEIAHLYVPSEHRDRGIGQDLLRISADYAWINDFDEISVCTPWETFEYFESHGYVYDSEISSTAGNSLFKMNKSLRTRYTEHSSFIAELSSKEFYQLVLSECPDYEKRFMLFDKKDLLYLFANDFAEYIVELYKVQHDDPFRRAIRLVHTLVSHSDLKISELGVIGILEDLQSIFLNNKMDDSEFVKHLTNECRLYWMSLNKFWNNEIPYVGYDIQKQPLYKPKKV